MTKHGPRCVHCAQHHGDGVLVCPWTGKAIPRSSQSTPATPPHTEVADEAHSLLGQTVGGKYFVQSILGRGGMGTVYEAANVQMGRIVALKVLHPKQLRRRESVKRFYQEARAAGAIGHPNICEVYDLGTLDNGCPYLVMERLAGSTLAQLMKQGVLSIEAAIDILVQVLSGLVVAHEKGIVHRDLKPDNIFLTERVGCPPVAKVLDFGVSKVVSSAPSEARDADLDLTKTGMVMGTPYYMSPEQASGVRDLDGRVDLYGCGVILYEILTGRRPFLGANYHVLLWNILKTEPPAPRDLRPELPAALESVIARAMARERADRYSSAAEFIAALSHVRGNLANYAVPAPRRASGQPPAPVSRRPSEAPVPTELPSHLLETHDSAELLAPPPLRVFDDISTGFDASTRFALAEEPDAKTTLMDDDAVAEISRVAREMAVQSGSHAPAEPFDPSRTEVIKNGPGPTRVPDMYADETVKMDRVDVPPSTMRVPKRLR